MIESNPQLNSIKESQTQAHAETTENATDNFLSKLNKIIETKHIYIEDINMENPSDQTLAVTVALRGKTEEDYFEIVNDLFKAQDQTQDKSDQDYFSELTSTIMQIGAENLRIDWS